MHAKNLVKVSRIGGVMENRKRTPTLRGTFPSNSASKIVLSKHFVLIMRIIIQIKINMDVIRQEKPREGPTLNLLKRIK